MDLSRCCGGALLTPLLLVLLVASPARAGDFWVDPVLGSDAGAGTSPTEAWRTLRHAFAETNGPSAHTLHLLPGTHFDSGSLSMTDSTSVVGVEGVDATFVDVMDLVVTPSGGPVAGTTLSGVTVRNTGRGIEVVVAASGTSPARVELEDVFFEDCAVGIEAEMSAGRRAEITARRVVVQGSAIGVLLGGDVAFTLEDSTIEGSVFRGLQAPDLIGTPIALAELNLVRSRVLGTVGTGIEVGGGFARVRVEDCLIEGSQQDGLLLFSLIGDVDVDRTTIARNGGSGLYLRVGAPNARVRGCVLAANAGPDVRLQNTLVDVRDSLVEDGNATGPGVLAGDPLFVDLAARDFRLRPSSPAVDVLAPSAAPDLDGVPRDADGDLDLVAGRDMGALELAPLRPLGPAVAGTDLELELIGPDPGMATIAISPVPLVAPAVSPYGALALDPVVAWRALRVVVPGGGVPALARLPLPSISVGETWGVQALLPSAAAPAGGAFSNPLEIEIE